MTARTIAFPTPRSVGKPGASFPGTIATDQKLAIAVDRQQTKLAGALSAAATSMLVIDASGLTPWSLVSIDNEIVQVTGAATANNVPITRGFDGTAAAVHISGTTVAGMVDAYHHNTLVAEVQAIETALGTNLVNLPVPIGVYSCPAYDFPPQSPGVNLNPGANAFTMSPIPKGLAVNDYLYISGGTGAAEAVQITGWNPATGAIIVNCTNAHTGAWTIRSASFGLQEAIVAAQAAGGGLVTIPAGSYTLQATVRITASNIAIQGAGVDTTLITRTGNFGNSIYAGNGLLNIHISGFTLTHTINYTEGPPPAVVNKPSSGAHIKLDNCAYSSIHDTALYNMPYAIDLDTVGWTRVYRNAMKSVWDASFAAVQIGIAGIYMHHSQNGFGFPTYLWVEENVITGYQSAPRTIVVNGNNITSHVDPCGAKYGVLVESCEACWIANNTMEFQNDSGIGIICSAPLSPTGALLALDIGGNYIDYNRLAAIKFDMSADPANRFALGTRIHDNWILGSNGTINGVYFAGAAVPTSYIRTAHETSITNNIFRSTLGSAIFMLAGGNTIISGNLMDQYNSLNSFPTNSFNTGVNPPTGDRTGNSGVYATGAVTSLNITGNRIGGNTLGAAYDGSSSCTVNGVTIGNLLFQAISEGPVVTTPNSNGGVQPPAARSPAVAYDPAFFAPSIAPSVNFINTETGANNAIAGSLTAPGVAPGVGLTPGMIVTVRLAHTLQAGANTFAYNGGAALAIKSARNAGNNIGTPYNLDGIISLIYDGVRWLDVSQ